MPVLEVGVLIPAYNEADRIAGTVAAVRRLPEVREIVVIDDGSTDQTAKRAAQAGARVLRLPDNCGKGRAVLYGAGLISSPYLALLDADVGESAVEIKHLFLPLAQGRADMTVALFPPAAGGGLGLVKKLAAWSVRRSTGCTLQAPLSGQRVMKRELLGLLRYPPDGFGLEVALNMDILNGGYRVLEVSTNMTHRKRGRDPGSILHRGRQMAAVLRELWRRRALLLKGEVRQ